MSIKTLLISAMTRQFHEVVSSLRARAVVDEPILARHRRQAAVQLAWAAMGKGEWRLAESALDAEPYGQTDPLCLTLLGVCAEMRGDLAVARRFYGCALKADKAFAPARQNLARIFELTQLGRSAQPIAVGDALLDLLLTTRFARLARGRAWDCPL